MTWSAKISRKEIAEVNIEDPFFLTLSINKLDPCPVDLRTPSSFTIFFKLLLVFHNPVFSLFVSTRHTLIVLPTYNLTLR